jgi:hypothetical protein
MMKIIKIYFLLFGLLSTGCTVDIDRNAFKSHIVKQHWKYGEGLNIGDWLDFNSIHKIKSDTILLGDSAIAIVKRIEKRMIGVDDKMQITSINGEGKGIYFAK